jgi:hypothetical protein
VAATVPGAVAAPARPSAVAAAVAAGALGWAALRWPLRDRWALRLVVAVAAAGAVGAVAGVGAGALVGSGLVLGAWVADGRSPAPALPAAGDGAAAPVVVLATVAGLALHRHEGLAWALAPLLAAWALPLVSRLGGGALHRVVRAVGDRAAALVSAVLFSLVGVVAVLVPWALQRATGRDPLAAAPGWLPRRRRAVAGRRLWAPEPVEPPPLRWPARLRTLALGTAIVGVAVWAIGPPDLTLHRKVQTTARPSRPFGVNPNASLVNVAGSDAGRLPPLEHPAPKGLKASRYLPGQAPGPGAALQDDLSWWNSGEFNSGQGYVQDPKGPWRGVNPYRQTDFRSRYVTIVDGARKTWNPPACSCRRLTLWMYGGSTTFGLNQRDDHTIASELSRVAYEHGIVLDVSNRGKNGHMHWLESELFALDLTVDPPPDLVIFYDGWNDRWAAGARVDLVPGGPSLIDPTSQDLWTSSERSAGPVPAGPPGSRLLPYQHKVFPLIEDAKRVVQQYDEARELSKATARAHGVQIHYYWQPSRYSRDVVLSESHFDEDAENYQRMIDQLLPTFLPSDVVDLTDSLSGNHDPLFTDDVHHNEKGARLVAEAIFADLQPDLRSLLEKGPAR